MEKKFFKFSKHFIKKLKSLGFEYTTETKNEILRLMHKYKPHTSYTEKHGESDYYTFYLYDKLVTIVCDKHIVVTIFEEQYLRAKYKNRK